MNDVDTVNGSNYRIRTWNTQRYLFKTKYTLIVCCISSQFELAKINNTEIGVLIPSTYAFYWA